MEISFTKNECVVAENYLCLPALIEMILRKERLPVFSQFEIGEQFGVVVPFNYQGSLNNYVQSSNPRNFGIPLDSNKIEQLFKSKNLPISVRGIWIKECMEYEFEKTIIDSLTKGYFVICGFSYSLLSKDPINDDIGHVSLITKLFANSVDSLVGIYDPGPYEPGFKTVLLSKLYKATHVRNGGLLIFKRQNRNC